MGKKKRRTIEQRIQDAQALLDELQTKKKQQVLTKALEEGRVAKEDEAEFKKLQKEMTALNKAAKIANSYNKSTLAAAIEELRDDIADSMRNMVNDDSADDDDEDDESSDD